MAGCGSSLLAGTKGTDAVQQQFRLRDVERMLGMSRASILGLVRSGFLAPARGSRRAYLFSFHDLLVLRAARALQASRLPAQRIRRSLRALRRRLPTGVPLSGLTLRAMGDHVIVEEGGLRWHADSGQYLLDFEPQRAAGRLQVLAPGRPDSAEAWFDRGWELEPASPREAYDAYSRALELDPAHCGARVNLGRLLHESGRFAEAEAVYRKGIELAPGDELLWFNLAVLLEDAGRVDDAIAAYRCALRLQPRFADCHYNLALLYDAAGNKLGAVRHLREYKRIVARGS
jgi:tetratricopeptide (TPR) repeat protein